MIMDNEKLIIDIELWNLIVVYWFKCVFLGLESVKWIFDNV